MEGNLGPLIEALQRAEFEEKLAALTGAAPVRRLAATEDE
jgi:hypothetical protein